MQNFSDEKLAKKNWKSNLRPFLHLRSYRQIARAGIFPFEGDEITIEIESNTQITRKPKEQ